MEGHKRYLNNRCRLCSVSLGGSHSSSKRRKDRKKACKTLFTKEFDECWNLDINSESKEVFSAFICSSCRRFLYRVKNGETRMASNFKVAQWTPHSNDECVCMRSRSGMAKSNLGEEITRGSDSDTDSAEETREELQKPTLGIVLNSLPWLTQELIVRTENVNC